MSTAIGLSTPVLAPLLRRSGTFALPFSAYFTFLSYRVVHYRLKDEHYLGDNSSKTGDLNNKLYLATRCHQNFVENVPLGITLAALAELNGGNRKTIATFLSALLVFRILHADAGLINGMGLGRPVGYWGTLATIGSLAGYAAYLVKGYWGL
ncbi:membrane-associated, eicosanoid/glutathione metabolism protein [Hypoxylon cercidicola]|nr:membrane-associated, eicosanoid/glutathione metabolism protein [Hypoxylon cercidicola]